jgi:putative membrane protein
MMKAFLFQTSIFAATTLMPAGAFADVRDVSEFDKEFATKAAHAGHAEVELGKLGQSKGTSDSVKSFGGQMVEDHSKANKELEKVAKQKNLQLPTGPDERQKLAYQKLEKLSGEEFDSAFMEQMVTDHQEATKLFEEASEKGKDPEIRQFASKTLPTIKHHLEMAQEESETEHQD